MSPECHISLSQIRQNNPPLLSSDDDYCNITDQCKRKEHTKNIFQKNIVINNLKNFFLLFTFLFLLYPIAYLGVSFANDSKRTDYPGKEIARLVQNKWDKNFVNEIKIVVGDEWYAGNLSYHLISRPMWTNELKDKASKINSSEGVIYTGNPEILKKICPGVYGTIKPVGYCMIGQK